MSLQALPLQFLTLGGEMMYIIDSRLQAQEIPDDKSEKVRNDIICTMLNKKFMEEMFKPQPLYAATSLKNIFSKLAHASIMKLNVLSMNKMYDLMLMSLKHQVLLATYPHDMLFSTLNHLDVMSTYATTSLARASVKNALALLHKTYSTMNVGELCDIRYALLNFVQDLKVRVSLFLKEDIQAADGNFRITVGGPVAPDNDIPGTIRYYNSSGNISKTINFPTGIEYLPAEPRGSLEQYGNRGTRLGLNMYDETYTEESAKSNIVSECMAEKTKHEDVTEGELSIAGRQELNLLLQLIGSNAPDKKEFKLNLFPDSFVEAESCSSTSGYTEGEVVINKDLQDQHRLQLGKIYGDLSQQHVQAEEKEDPDDLLTLLDTV